MLSSPKFFDYSHLHTVHFFLGAMVAMKKNFSMAQAFKFGFLTTFKNLPILFSVQLLRSLFWVTGLAIFWILFYGFLPTYKVLTQSFFYGQGMYSFHDCFDLLSGTKIFLASCVLGLIDTVFLCTLLEIGFEIHDGGEKTFFSVLPSFALVLNMILLNIIYKGIVALGFLLLIIPGLMWATQFGFATKALVDRGEGPIEALRTSSVLTKGIRIKLFCFWAMALLVNVVGYLLLGVGTLITMPATLLAQIFVYRHLQK